MDCININKPAFDIAEADWAEFDNLATEKELICLSYIACVITNDDNAGLSKNGVKYRIWSAYIISIITERMLTHEISLKKSSRSLTKYNEISRGSELLSESISAVRAWEQFGFQSSLPKTSKECQRRRTRNNIILFAIWIVTFRPSMTFWIHAVSLFRPTPWFMQLKLNRNAENN